ncbi:3-hydroxyacyl-CoA dehydrogenase family protein, partial [Ruminococcaceae bacterium OttesenSCG-928-O06]|nr:3-hydroxyacyl-CoA dehydrogenase family protein [Ruminococcaceae bacterium OttesenSCG-928-O06]
EKTDEKYVEAAKQFYLDCKKEPVVLKKELLGFISNRIQQAVWREMCEIVMRGACSFEDADKAVTFGPGLRWGIMGPGLIFRLGAGRDGQGFAHPGMQKSVNLWLDDMATWTRFPDEWRSEVSAKGMAEEMANRPAEIGNDYDSLAAYRDKMLVELLKLHGKL